MTHDADPFAPMATYDEICQHTNGVHNVGATLSPRREAGEEEHLQHHDEEHLQQHEFPPPGRPMAVARVLVDDRHRDVDRQLTLRHWRGSFYEWRRGSWVEVEERKVRASIYRALEVLGEICHGFDEVDAMQAALADHDLVVSGSAGQPRPNPLIAELRAHRLALSKLIAALDLPSEDGQVLPSPQSLRGRRAAESRWARSAAVRASRRGHGQARADKTTDRPTGDTDRPPIPDRLLAHPSVDDWCTAREIAEHDALMDTLSGEEAERASVKLAAVAWRRQLEARDEFAREHGYDHAEMSRALCARRGWEW